MRHLAVVAAALLAVTACKPGPSSPATTPATAPKPLSPLDVYRECVEAKPADRALQDRCQTKAWGAPFEEDDDRWSCRWMGDLKCGSPEGKA